MEVHHHPNVEKKTFKEYLLEGLMIFIAVSMGFFAETIREGINEHHRAGVYAASMIKDLEEDTAELHQVISYFDYANRNIDTLMQLLASAEPRQIPSGKLYWYGLFGGTLHPFVPNDATFEQMKSSGTLSYFEKDVAVQVARYNRSCRAMKETEEDNREVYTEVRRSRAKLFEFHYNDLANEIAHRNQVAFDWARVDSFMASNPPLLSMDKVLFNEYVEMVRSRRIPAALRNARSLLSQADTLIRSLKEVYGD